MSFTYHWLHIPTGETGVETVIKIDRLKFLEELNRWNQLGPNWKYWE